MQVAEVELVYRSKVKPYDRPVVAHNTDAYTIFLEHWNADTIELIEEFKLLLLNRAHRVLGIYALSRGGMTGTVMDPKLVFVAALKAAATSIIVCHNHPSGNLRPSERDKVVTQQLKEAGALLEIRVLDHLIISSEGYYSFADEGLL
jgi:DNA repair protein RadC